MKKVIIFMVLVLLAGSAVAQEVHEYEMWTTGEDDAGYLCETTKDLAITRDGRARGGIAARVLKGSYPMVQFRVMHEDARLVALCNGCLTKQVKGNPARIHSMSITFANGEEVTFETCVLIDRYDRMKEAASREVARYAEFAVRLSNAVNSSVKGNLKGMSELARVEYVIELLQEHHVRSIAMRDYKLTFETYPTAETFWDMFFSLEACVWDWAEYAGDKTAGETAKEETATKTTATSTGQRKGKESVAVSWKATFDDGFVYEYSGTVSPTPTADGSPFEVLREAVDGWGEVRTGVLSSGDGGVVVYKSNGYQRDNVPLGLANALKEGNEKGWKIADICLNCAEAWAVFFTNGEYRTGNCPGDFLAKLKEFRAAGERVVCAAITDPGEWVLVGYERYAASDKTLAFIKEAEKMYGKVHRVALSNGSVVVGCERGMKFQSIPKKLEECLREIDFIPRVIKYRTDGLYIVTDEFGERGKYRYFL